MHRIYFGKRCITVCPASSIETEGQDTRQLHPSSPSDITSAVTQFRDSDAPEILCIPSDNEEGTYRSICSAFREVNAAGGLVTDTDGKHLVIRRFGIWDLPKGHQEEGEDIERTALREVMEETGLQKLETRGLICVTDHCYIRDGIWHLKHTWWYDMLNTGPSELVPQGEEDITEAAWVAGADIQPILENTYPSIEEVFRRAKS